MNFSTKMRSSLRVVKALVHLKDNLMDREEMMVEKDKPDKGQVNQTITEEKYQDLKTIEEAEVDTKVAEEGIIREVLPVVILVNQMKEQLSRSEICLEQ